jgi:hypothetical protein
MAEETFFIAGGIIIGILVFLLAYRFFIITSHNSLKTLSVNEFNKLYSSIDFACMQEKKSSIKVEIAIPEFVRAVYASDSIEMMPKVTENIKNGKISSGEYVCMQFKTEQKPRCQRVSCKVFIPFAGSLETWNDLKLLVNKILGRPMVKEYSFSILKTSYGVDVTYDDYPSFKSPVVAIAYIPLVNGKVDLTKTGKWRDDNKDNLERYIIEQSNNLTEALTQGTRYKFFANHESRPNINYYLVEARMIYDDVPTKNGKVDLEKVLKDVDVCSFSEDGVKEFWLWVYDGYKPIEFSTVMGYAIKDEWNMDIDADGKKDYSSIGKAVNLPVCRNSYTIHTFVIPSSKGIIIGNYTHSIEAILSYVDEDVWINFNKSCGTTDCPPNLDWSTCLYRWNSENLKESNCIDWKPDGGIAKQISCHDWYGISCKDDDGFEYKVWWMQNIPGRNNGIKLSDGRKVKDWWAFIADFDNAIKDKRLIE